ncbi:MAG: hypothetical protein ACFFDT_39365, partial [Candidatus Hodarchaeota archaeon]
EVVLQRRIDKEILDFCHTNKIPAAKLVGSSGSLVILSDEKPDFLLNFKLNESLSKEYNLVISEPIISDVFKLKPGRSLE